MGTTRDWQVFQERADPDADPYGRPQRVLNALVMWRSDSAPHIQDFYEHYSAMLLEGVGQPGQFFGGSSKDPLPTMADRSS